MAPQSIRSAGPFAVGISGARGERSTPLILPTTNWPPTSMAPVLPADTNASASPCFTRFIPTTIEEFFFFLIAITGGSSNPITSSACTIVTRSLSYLYFASSVLMSSVLPTNTTCILSFSLTASIAPFIGACGALSPPMASTTTLIISLIFHLILHLFSSILIYTISILLKNSQLCKIKSSPLMSCLFIEK